MRLLTTKLLVFIFGTLFLHFGASAVNAEMSPRDGYVRSPSGAPLVGVTVVEYTDMCPLPGVMSSSYPMCPEKTNCYAERTTKTDANGYYTFAPGTPPGEAGSPNYCEFLDWRRFTCSNPRVFYKLRAELPGQASGIIKAAHAVEGDLNCPPVQHPTNNTPAVITTDLTCPPPAACNVACERDDQCAGALDGCTMCKDGVCKPPPSCNTPCERDDQCAGARGGCTACLPGDNGEKVCRPPAACNVDCTRDDQCAGARDGCTACVPKDDGTGSACQKPPACNSACTRDDQCIGDAARNGCTSCMPADNGQGKVCRPPAACGVACTRNDQCAGARDGCTQCLEGTCSDFNENMCKCDGFNALELHDPPRGNYVFEAFGKVEGNDIAKAKIESISFRIYKSSKSNPNEATVIAQSGAVVPTLVENSSAKVRYRAQWSVPPPQKDLNALYRVRADIKCTPKKITTQPQSQASLMNNATVLGESNLYSPKALAQANPTPDDNLQLKTLNFTRIVEADNCKQLTFEYFNQ